MLCSDNETVSGTFINGQRLDSADFPEGLQLKSGDVIKLGTSKYKLHQKSSFDNPFSCSTGDVEFKFLNREEEAARKAREASFNVPSAQEINREKFD